MEARRIGVDDSAAPRTHYSESGSRRSTHPFTFWNVWGALKTTWRMPLLIAIIAATLFAAGFLTLRAFNPPTVTYATHLQLTFPQAGTGRYPNGSVFTINEIVEPANLKQVYDELDLGRYGVKWDAFFNSFSIQPYAPEGSEIVERFRTQLADRRLTLAEREQLEGQLRKQLEQASRNAARVTLTLQQMTSMPYEVGRAVVAAVPRAWARSAINVKGVLNLPGFYASNTVIDASTLGLSPTPIAIVQVMEANERVLARINELKSIDGMTTILDPSTQRSFRDIERAQEETKFFFIDPLRSALLSNSDLGDGLERLEQIINLRTQDLASEAATLQRTAEAIKESLNQYVESVVGLRRSGGSQSGSSSPGPTVIPQLSEGFIDRIIQLSGGRGELDQSYVADLNRRWLDLHRRLVVIQAERDRWNDLIAKIRAKDGQRVKAEEPQRAEVDKSLTTAVTRMNDIWSTLTRMQSHFAAGRVSHTGQLYVPLLVDRDIILAYHPFLGRWTVALGAFLVALIFFGLWGTRSARKLLRDA